MVMSSLALLICHHLLNMAVFININVSSSSFVKVARWQPVSQSITLPLTALTSLLTCLTQKNNHLHLHARYKSRDICIRTKVRVLRWLH